DKKVSTKNASFRKKKKKCKLKEMVAVDSANTKYIETRDEATDDTSISYSLDSNEDHATNENILKESTIETNRPKQLQCPPGLEGYRNRFSFDLSKFSFDSAISQSTIQNQVVPSSDRSPLLTRTFYNYPRNQQVPKNPSNQFSSSFYSPFDCGLCIEFDIHEDDRSDSAYPSSPEVNSYENYKSRLY
ncbi:hypothetical protein ROZALSC1DRAFT_30768, partial [Rozella allomycis CSF55]